MPRLSAPEPLSHEGSPELDELECADDASAVACMDARGGLSVAVGEQSVSPFGAEALVESLEAGPELGRSGWRQLDIGERGA